MMSLRSPILILAFAVLAANGQFEGDECVRKYDNSPGICKNFRNCPKAREEYNRGIPVTTCAYLSGQAIICCPQEGAVSDRQPSPKPNFGKRISAQKCEEYTELTGERILVNPLSLGSSNSHAIFVSKCNPSTPLIVGGVTTKPGELPHMAAIGWQSIDGIISFKCGGSLISERFVLTAAHCARSGGAPPSIVRLGDQNINSRRDGLNELDVNIAEFIKHEKYRSREYYYDIALIRLARSVEFTKYIRPACLWQTNSINTTKTIASGWGSKEIIALSTSDELMKVELDILSNSHCNNLISDDSLDEGIIDSQLCAAVLAGRKDTCGGDSGGPIQITTESNLCLFHIIGVTSFGNSLCAQRNSPGVYTRVSSFLDWIEDRVWR